MKMSHLALLFVFNSLFVMTARPMNAAEEAGGSGAPHAAAVIAQPEPVVLAGAAAADADQAQPAPGGAAQQALERRMQRNKEIVDRRRAQLHELMAPFVGMQRPAVCRNDGLLDYDQSLPPLRGRLDEASTLDDLDDVEVDIQRALVEIKIIEKSEALRALSRAQRDGRTILTAGDLQRMELLRAELAPLREAHATCLARGWKFDAQAKKAALLALADAVAQITLFTGDRRGESIRDWGHRNDLERRRKIFQIMGCHNEKELDALLKEMLEAAPLPEPGVDLVKALREHNELVATQGLSLGRRIAARDFRGASALVQVREKLRTDERLKNAAAKHQYFYRMCAEIDQAALGVCDVVKDCLKDQMLACLDFNWGGVEEPRVERHMPGLLLVRGPWRELCRRQHRDGVNDLEGAIRPALLQRTERLQAAGEISVASIEALKAMVAAIQTPDEACVVSLELLLLEVCTHDSDRLMLPQVSANPSYSQLLEACAHQHWQGLLLPAQAEVMAMSAGELDAFWRHPNVGYDLSLGSLINLLITRWNN